jgi:hypothetical protein
MKYKGLPSTELREPPEAVFGSYDDPPNLPEAKLHDGMTSGKESPTGMSDEQKRLMALRAIFVDRPEYFKNPNGEPAL